MRAAYDVAARQGVEALTVRAVAERARVSHGTVLFHFKRRDELVSTLLERVLYAAATLRVPDDVERITRPSERLLALMRAEMQRLSSDPRHFRLFLEYWAVGVRSDSVRRSVSSALQDYRNELRVFSRAVVDAQGRGRDGRKKSARSKGPSEEGVAAVAASLIHGCALQAVIDPKDFDVHQHFDAAARMLDQLAPA